MTGWNEHGHAVMTGLPIDRYLGSGDLQDAENCGYAPTSVLAELGVDTTFGDPQVQYRDGRIRLLDGTLLERGGTLNCVWAVTVLPAYGEADVDALAAVLNEAREAGIRYGHYTLARWLLERWAVRREQAAYTRGVAEGRRQATEGLTREWGVAYPARRWPLSFDTDESEARAFADRGDDRSVVSRLVGPWEPTEQAEDGAR